MKENVAPGQRLMAVVYAKLSSCRRHSGTHLPNIAQKQEVQSEAGAVFFSWNRHCATLLPAAGNSFVQKQNGALPVAKFTCHSTKVCSPKLTSASSRLVCHGASRRISS